ncbi:MAG TPA: hypothetical protein VLG76_04970 [Rhabdochlamydiaceae bacterium]|nr:hypothetical protein [Rhabdochlamydiaceae bacterium]
MQKFIVLSIVSILFSCFYGCNKQDDMGQPPRDRDHREGGHCGG